MDVGAMPEPMPHPVLYLAYEGADRIYYNTFDGTSWSTPSELENYGDLSPSGPHVCSFNNQLCMFYKSDGHVHCQGRRHTSAGAAWSAPTLVQEGALFPLGTKVDFYPKGSVRYVSSSDYFYVDPGFAVANWGSLPANVQNAFLDTQQNNFALQTNAPNFQNPTMTQHAEYDAGTDRMASLFFFQFHPKDLAVGTYTFTGTWSATALANPPSYEPIYYQSTITVVIVTPVPAGGKKKVQLASGVELIFSSVTAEGYAGARATSETSAVKAPPLPNLVGQCYDVSVTASFSGDVDVGLTYDDSNLTQQQENSLQMMQYNPIAGDVKGDYGQVNILDIGFIAKCFQTTPDDPNWDLAADVNLDDKINILDISTCAKNFGKTAEWTNITTYVDAELNIVRGETTHFSIFGVT